MDPEALPPNFSSLPSVRARVLAFVGILVAGACGAMIGWGIVDLQCRGACGGPAALGAVAGAALAAGGVAVVAVLVLRAMGEWRRIQAEAHASTSRRNASA
ncbi:MAG: hypothetical protein C4344_07285 [Acidimicrobiia bacterium]